MNSDRFPLMWLILGGMFVLGAFAWQQRSIHQLRGELAHLRDTIPEIPEAVPSEVVARAPSPQFDSDSPEDPQPVDPGVSLEPRISALEMSVLRLNEGADHLMDRGTLPPSEAKLEEWAATFMNPGAPEQARVTALQMLRRNDAFTPGMAQVAAAWLTSSLGTDDSLTRKLLVALRGEPDPAVKAATLNLAATGPDERVRDQAIQNMRNYGGDPQVEALLWELAGSDPSSRIQRQAESTLRRLPMTEDRAANLQERALNGAAPAAERLVSLRLLRGRKEDISLIAPALAQAASATSDAETRVAYFKAFDDVNDPSFLLPLVEGVQAAEADVRRRAVDSLVDYRSEPAIADLLRSMAEADPDPGVRQEAARIYRYVPR